MQNEIYYKEIKNRKAIKSNKLIPISIGLSFEESQRLAQKLLSKDKNKKKGIHIKETRCFRCLYYNLSDGVYTIYISKGNLLSND